MFTLVTFVCRYDGSRESHIDFLFRAGTPMTAVHRELGSFSHSHERTYELRPLRGNL